MSSIKTQEVSLDTTHAKLRAALLSPPSANRVVLLLSLSSGYRTSDRNRKLALDLRDVGFSVMSLDLLSAHEDSHECGALLRCDLDALAARIGCAVSWLRSSALFTGQPIGVLASGVAAAAALKVAASSSAQVSALASHSGRLDLLPESVLAQVACPTYLVVGDGDPYHADAAQRSGATMTCPLRIDVMPSAGYMLDDFVLDRVSELTAEWFHANVPIGERA